MTTYQVIKSGSQDDPRTAAEVLPRKRPTRTARPQVLARIDPVLLADSTAHSLLAAQTEPPAFTPDYPVSESDAQKLAVNKGRSLITPHEYSDTNLRRYLMALAPLALSASAASRYADSLSPRLVPLLLGGTTFTQLEELTERVLEVLHFQDELVEPTLTAAMHLVGFGADRRHMHYDTQELRRLYPLTGELDDEHLRRITAKGAEPPLPNMYGPANRHGALKYTLRNSQGSFAEFVPEAELYEAELQRKVLRHKWWVMARTIELFHPASGCISEASRQATGLSDQDWLSQTQVTQAGFALAVRLVFERPWHELDLQGNPSDDVIKVMARLLIHRLSRGVRKSAKKPTYMSPRALIGMSLLTGVPTPKFVRFALDDLIRRGETFIDAEGVRRCIELVDESEDVFHLASSGWMEEMNALAVRLETSEHPTRAYFAYRMRQANQPLTSTRGCYQISEVREDESVVFRPRIDPKLIGLSEEL